MDKGLFIIALETVLPTLFVTVISSSVLLSFLQTKNKVENAIRVIAKKGIFFINF